MSVTKLKQLVRVLLWGGLGFATSSILGLDGFRDTIQLPQLVIGVCSILIALVINLIIIKRNK